jgi:hypothetical protein
MDYIFVDTGIFEENNFLETEAMQQLLKLGEEEELVIVLPRITYNEVLNRAKVRIRAGIDQLNTAKPYMRTMRNIPSRMPLFEKVKADTVVGEFTDVFAQAMRQAKYLEPYPTVDVTGVFTDYFAGKRPFGKGDKKHEFPDAFALITIEQWCAKEGHKCLVFSTDKDLLTYKSPHLEMVPDYKEYLNERQQDYAETKGSIKEALRYITEQTPAIELAVDKWVREQLDDQTRYTDVINYMDIHDLNVKQVDVSLGEITSTTVAFDAVKVELQVSVAFIVEVEIPDEETGWFDDEEREWHYFETRTVEIERTIDVPIKLEVEVSAEDGRAEAEGYDIAEINKGDDLVIEDEERYHKYYK